VQTWQVIFEWQVAMSIDAFSCSPLENVGVPVGVNVNDRFDENSRIEYVKVCESQ
jgi:hypothetical protein